MKNLPALAAGILIGAALALLATFYFGRYSLHSFGQWAIIRIDRFTGETWERSVYDIRDGQSAWHKLNRPPQDNGKTFTWEEATNAPALDFRLQGAEVKQ